MDNHGHWRTAKAEVGRAARRELNRSKLADNDQASLPASLWSARRSLPGSARPSTRGPAPSSARSILAAQGPEIG
jgi:hypothetical protein